MEKLVANVHGQTEYVIYIRNLKQRICFGKIQKDIKFNQNAWRKPYIDIKTDLKKTKNDFEKDFFEWMNNINFGKTTKNVRIQTISLYT